MERLLQLAGNPASLSTADKPFLEETVLRDPWFILPKLLLLRLARQTGDTQTASEMQNALALRLTFYPIPGILLEQPDWSSMHHRPSMELVEEFLAVEDKRIVPTESEELSSDDLSIPSEPNEADDLISEQLAKIYAAQGLNEKAEAIYRRLSLKFPEKSIYFADCVANLYRN